VGRVFPRHNHRGWPLNAVDRRHFVTEFAIVMLLVLYPLGFMLQAGLLTRLRSHHTAIFQELGSPTLYTLNCKLWPRPDYRLQWRFFRFLFSGRFLRLRDPTVSATALGSIVCGLGFILVFIALAGRWIK
jgi:hypothetical protein